MAVTKTRGLSESMIMDLILSKEKGGKKKKNSQEPNFVKFISEKQNLEKGFMTGLNPYLA